MIANGLKIRQVGSACLHVVNCSQLIHHSCLNISLLQPLLFSSVAVTALSSTEEHTHQTQLCVHLELCMFAQMYSYIINTFNIFLCVIIHLVKCFHICNQIFQLNLMLIFQWMYMCNCALVFSPSVQCMDE